MVHKNLERDNRNDDVPPLDWWQLYSNVASKVISPCEKRIQIAIKNKETLNFYSLSILTIEDSANKLDVRLLNL